MEYNKDQIKADVEAILAEQDHDEKLKKTLLHGIKMVALAHTEITSEWYREYLPDLYPILEETQNIQEEGSIHEKHDDEFQMTEVDVYTIGGKRWFVTDDFQLKEYE